MNGYKWELYDLSADPTQAEDLASKNTKKLEEMQQLFVAEAKKYNVFPLNNQVLGLFDAPRPSPSNGRSVFTYAGELSGVPHGAAPDLLDKSYKITAEIEVPQGGADGILVTQGGRFGGYGFYLLHSRPVFVWNLLDLKRMRWEGRDTLTPGKHTLVFDFTYDGGLGKGGAGTLKVDDKVVASQRMDRSIPIILQWDEAFDVGVDTATPVDDKDYQVPFRFTGKITQLTIELPPTQLTSQQQSQVNGANRKASD
jgi:arylsulfatase